MAGVGALVHGIGEIAQGNVATTGPFLMSWTHGPIFEYLGGEPGLTLLPNVLASGIVTSVAALALIAAAVRLGSRQGGGWVLLGLSTLLLFSGGGVGPPVIGLCAGAAALAAWRRPRLPATALRGSAPLRTGYRTLVALSTLLVAFLVFGSLFVALVLRVDVSNAFVAAFLASVVALPATIVVGMRVPGAAEGGKATA
jgi:hypothetical protein